MRSRWHDSTTPPMIVQMLNSCAPSSSSASARHLTMMRSLSSGIPPPRVACHRLGCGRFSRRRASGSFGSVRGQSRRRSAARFSRSIGGALQGTHLGDVQAERLVGRGDEGRPLAGLNLETPESHLLLASSLSSVGEAVFDDVARVYRDSAQAAKDSKDPELLSSALCVQLCFEVMEDVRSRRPVRCLHSMRLVAIGRGPGSFLF